MKYGIDVSKHNGDIEWGLLKKTIDFAIIRAGYGAGNIDEKAEYNVEECEHNGIPYGLYWFSYAKDAGEAIIEAKHMEKFCKDKSPTYPLYFDWEDASMKYTGLSKNDGFLISDIASAFLKTLSNAGTNGAYVGIYTNVYYMNTIFHSDLFGLYDKWLAKWDKSAGDNIFRIPYSTRMWQYTSTGRVPHILGNVDLNMCDFDYPALIGEKRLNIF